MLNVLTELDEDVSRIGVSHTTGSTRSEMNRIAQVKKKKKKKKEAMVISTWAIGVSTFSTLWLGVSL